MRVLAVLPFEARGPGADAADVARWLFAETASQLLLPGVLETRLVEDAVAVEAAALGKAARQLAAQAALSATVALDGEELILSPLLAGPEGTEKAAWVERVPLGAALQLPALLARAVLLALGEDASLPAQEFWPAAPPEDVLWFCSAVRQMDEGDTAEGVDGLLRLVEKAPPLDAARRALLRAAREAAGGERMPDFFSALERLLEALPGDAEALLAAADYRALHFDEPGARELCLRAREAAETPELGAQALGKLSELSAKAGREDEAIAHLRSAVRLSDDAGLYARLGSLLLRKDGAEGLRMLARATVLAPDDASLQLQLARALREQGADPERALVAAAAAARLCAGQPALEEEVRAELLLQLGEAG